MIENIGSIPVGTLISFKAIKTKKLSLYNCHCNKHGTIFRVTDKLNQNEQLLCTRAVCCNELTTFNYRSQNQIYEVFIRDDIEFVIV
jgi:predicted SprT family Zn-dependent metalloprotease